MTQAVSTSETSVNFCERASNITLLMIVQVSCSEHKLCKCILCVIKYQGQLHLTLIFTVLMSGNMTL
jgi:hypothetical protein